MKLLILGKLFSDNSQDLGIYQKVLGIQAGFSQNGIETDVLTISSNCLLLNGQQIKKLNKRCNNWYFFNSYFEDVNQSISVQEYDAVWVRHHFFGKSIFNFLKSIRKRKNTIKILYELPTYPYLQEFKWIKKGMAAYVEACYKKNFKKHIDRIITYSKHQEIYGVNTIQINNGINSSLYNTVNKDKIERPLKLVAIGKLWDWFGIDRLLKGLITIQGEDRVILDIIGGGKEMITLKTFCEKHNLENVVTFHGWKNKNQIDTIISNADLGVGTLAIHRKSVAYSSSLKHREYSARGLPFIYSGSDVDFDDCVFTFIVKENEEAIDIAKIIRWRASLQVSSESIAEFATERLDWKVQLYDIVRYLRS